MVRTRPIRLMLVAFGVLGGACSSSAPAPSGGGGSHGTAGVPGQAGATGTGGSSATGGTTGGGGAAQPGAGGDSSTGGSASPGTGGAATAGDSGSGAAGLTGTAGAGGTAGGSTAGSAGTGGRTSAGSAGQGGSAGATVTGTGGGASGAGGAMGSTQSGGCGKTPTLKNGTINITFNNASRKYILRIPDGYDNSHPYRLVLAYAWSGASASQVVSANYFTFATQDSKNTIFAAPDAAGGAGSWSNSDVAFTDAILEQLEGDLCVDKTRVFASGFSFGGGMAMALACTRADVFRAVAFFSGADLTNSCPKTLTTPIAYYASQASQDSNGMSPTSEITGEKKQAEFAALNGCMPEPTSTNFPSAGQPHVCTNYKGCSAGHPTEYCVFNGPHGWEPTDPGQSKSWDAPEAWKFITQF